jgi:hypothetical protein
MDGTDAPKDKCEQEQTRYKPTPPYPNVHHEIIRFPFGANPIQQLLYGEFWRYVILESTVTVMERSEPDEVWRTTVLTSDDVLRKPGIGIEIPAAEFYEGISFPDQEEASA